MRRKKYKVSKAEYEIKTLLEEHGFIVEAQYRIVGIPFIYDFFLPELNKIIEYQGSYWHCDPRQYKTGTLIKMRGFKEKVLVDYVWDKDTLKRNCAEKHGIKVCEVWEEDYKAHGWRAILKAIR